MTKIPAIENVIANPNGRAILDTEHCSSWLELMGDLGWQDEQGYVYIADRRSNLIISGGVNIYPAEVEAVLLEHTAVVDAVVIGIDDIEWGKRVHAVIQPVSGQVDDETRFIEELNAFVRQRLAKFKVPRSFELVAQLPRFDSGKLYFNRLAPDGFGHSQAR